MYINAANNYNIFAVAYLKIDIFDGTSKKKKKSRLFFLEAKFNQ